ncbi:MAG: DUF4221 domain-containing protein [Bacteroidaceae bacterium]|nr:DUF4221 domain-containing protein [Bacteroidaceae bacterium]
MMELCVIVAWTMVNFKYLTFIIVLFSALVSCKGFGTNAVSEVSLVETSDTVCFNITPDVRTYNHSFQVFTDTDGREYATFLNRRTAQIFMYDITGGEPVKVVNYHKEGPDGIGVVYSHYMKSWNEFLIPGQNRTIYILDSCARIREKMDFSQVKGVTGFESYADNPFVIKDDILYSYQSSRRGADHCLQDSPTEIALNLKTKEFVHSPNLSSDEIKNYLIGKNVTQSEVGMIYKCLNGKSLVYSFAYNEDLIVMSMDFRDISYKKAVSKYIGQLKIPDYPESMDFDERCRQTCTNPYYGQIVYDPYRKYYYRFAYPRTELENHTESWYDLTQSGRDEFSIIILDEDLNVIGETMFPRDRFRSNLYFVCKDGFYISCNHYKNPGYTDDAFQFVKFEVKGK